jgi:hypothetical protein
MSHIGDRFLRRRHSRRDGIVDAMRTKLTLLSITLLFVFLLAGCVVRTHRHGHHRHGHHKRGCPSGYSMKNGKCFKHGPPPGHVKVRDHR